VVWKCCCSEWIGFGRQTPLLSQKPTEEVIIRHDLTIGCVLDSTQPEFAFNFTLNLSIVSAAPQGMKVRSVIAKGALGGAMEQSTMNERDESSSLWSCEAVSCY
jgi:hypothetical protein